MNKVHVIEQSLTTINEKGLDKILKAYNKDGYKLISTLVLDKRNNKIDIALFFEKI